MPSAVYTEASLKLEFIVVGGGTSRLSGQWYPRFALQVCRSISVTQHARHILR